MVGLRVDLEGGRLVFHSLAAAYSSPARAYHTLDHVGSVLATLARMDVTPEQGPALLLAGWFHDAVYDSRVPDNEEQSGRLAETVLLALGVQPTVVEETVRLILLTKTHSPAPNDLAGQRLVDADLAILGEPAAEYAAYARGIRREYAWVAEEDYRAGRSKVLEAFLSRPAIYATPLFRAERETTARANLRQEIAELAKPRTD
jgi:predicted metal-dependent HD superfamily phosphohydrolase